MVTKELVAQIKYEEGCRLKAYRCSEGFLTIGYGWNIDANPTYKGKKVPLEITQKFAEELLTHSLGVAQASLLAALPWVSSMTQARQDALTNMVFQMGIKGLLKFKNSLGFVQIQQYRKAAENFMKSLWAKQTPKRAKRVCGQLSTGVYYPVPSS